MRIGILTLPLHTNYGGILQAYALQTVLERMGHEAVVFDRPYIVKLPLWKTPLSYTKRCIKKYILKRENITIRQEVHSNRVKRIMRTNTQIFVNKYVNLKYVGSLSKLDENDFDALIVGSDQVWRPRYFKYIFKSPVEEAYLKFAEKWNVLRISYAASYGSDVWEYSDEETSECKALIKKFNAISLREKSGVVLCKEHLGAEAKHVLDPTMLLCADDYMKLCQADNTPQSKGNLLNYILDDNAEKEALIEYIAKEKNLMPFRVNSKVDDSKAPVEERVQPPLEQWIRGFYDAEFVVTDSFHACVFSILFRKQFIAYGNEDRGLSRFKSLLDMFGLEDRLVSGLSHACNLQPIDYDEVYKKYHDMKEYSYSFLKDALAK